MLKTIPPSCRKHTENLLWVAAIVAGTLAPAAWVLFSGYTLVWRDSSKLFQPVRPVVEQALRTFQLPLWNPYEALGLPLFAQMMHSVLHPVSILGAFLCPGAGMDLYIVVYFALAALGAAVLARVLGVSRSAALVAAFGYGLSGYLQGMSSNIQYLCAAATAPWVVAGLRMTGCGTPAGIAVGAVGVATAYFAGDPQWAIVAFFLGAALAFDAAGGRGAVRCAASVAIGTAVAAVQWLPTLAYLKLTSRGPQLDALDRLQWALPPWRILEFVAPGFFGSPQLGTTKWPVFLWLDGVARPGLEMPFLPGAYLGVALLLLAAAGVRQARLTKILAGAAMLLLWLSLGYHAGADQMLRHLPVWGKFRYAEKMVGPLTLCVSLLAAFGAERIAARPSRSVTALAGVATVLALAGMALPQWVLPQPVDPTAAAQEAIPLARHYLAAGLVHCLLGGIAVSMLAAAALRWQRVRPYIPQLAAVVILVQSAVAAHVALHPGVRQVVDRQPLAQLKCGSGPVRVATPFEENYRYPRGIDQFDAQDGGQSHLGVPAYNVASQIDQVNTYTGLRPLRYDSFLQALRASVGVGSVAALRRYALSHVVVKTPYTDAEAQVAMAATATGTAVLSNEYWDFVVWQVPHRPWASFAPAAVTADEGQALDLTLGAIQREDATAVVEGKLPRGFAAGQVLAFSRTPNKVRIDAEAPGDAFLVVNDAYWHGWRATIDGADVPVLRTDYLVRGVEWPRGRHVLDMRYTPPELPLALAVSGLGLLGLVALIAADRRQRVNSTKTLTKIVP